MHDEPPHVIAPVQACPASQSITQLAAAAQSMVPGQSFCDEQLTSHGTFAGHTTVGHAIAVQSKTQVGPLHAPPACVHDAPQGSGAGVSAGASMASAGASLVSAGASVGAAARGE